MGILKKLFHAIHSPDDAAFTSKMWKMILMVNIFIKYFTKQSISIVFNYN